MTALDGEAYGLRTNLFQVPRDEFMNALRRLVRDETKSEFSARPCGDNCLAAFALVTAGQPVDFDCWAGRPLFLRGETAFAEQSRDAEKSAVGDIVVRDAAQLLPFVFGQRNDVVIEAGDGDAAVFVSQLREQLAQGHRRIVHRPAVNAGVQIARWSVYLDLHRADAAQRVGQRRMFQVWDPGV